MCNCEDSGKNWVSSPSKHKESNSAALRRDADDIGDRSSIAGGDRPWFRIV